MSGIVGACVGRQGVKKKKKKKKKNSGSIVG
jgi:hypothetical protein